MVVAAGAIAPSAGAVVVPAAGAIAPSAAGAIAVVSVVDIVVVSVVAGVVVVVSAVFDSHDDRPAVRARPRAATLNRLFILKVILKMG